MDVAIAIEQLTMLLSLTCMYMLKTLNAPRSVLEERLFDAVSLRSLD